MPSERSGRSAVGVVWRLENAAGREIAQRAVGVEGTEEDWRKAGDAMVERLAALSADAVAPLLVKGSVKEPSAPELAALAGPIPGSTEPNAALPGPPLPKPPVPNSPGVKPALPDLLSAKPAVPATSAPATSSATGPARNEETGRIRVAVRRITGAPGDGATSLAGAVTSILRQQDLTIVDPGGKADLTIDGEVSLAPAGPDQQHVKIVWRVRNASGAELGTVGQENDVPRGMLSGPWGDVAYAVAAAAGDGLLQVLARAALPANPAAGTAASAAAREPPKAGPGQPSEQPPDGKTSQPAASAVKAAKTKGQP
jgi:hypothetical protein